jgi:hypothetical protein
MKENPDKEILDTLQISFDGLEETEKKIFLDIASLSPSVYPLNGFFF